MRRLLIALFLCANLLQAQAQLNLQDLFTTRKFAPNFFNGGKWSGAGAVLNYINENNIVSYHLLKDSTAIDLEGAKLLASDTGQALELEEYVYNNNRSKILLYTESAQVWRLNTKGYYYVYDIASNTILPLSDRTKGYQMFAQFSPDGQKVAFVRDRNVFTIDLTTNLETQHTFDGSEGKIINGTYDWVYEEEFYQRDGLRWSPDSKYLAFAKLDESNTKDFSMMDYQPFYPTTTTFRYPKAGTPNAEIQMGIIPINGGEIKFFDTDTWFEGGDETEYIAGFGWTPATTSRATMLYMYQLNRDQNVLKVLLGNPMDMQVSTLMTEREETYIDFGVEGKKFMRFIENGTKFIWASEMDGYNHLYLYKADGSLETQLTKGAWEVENFLGIDEKTKTLYFTATKKSARERHLYKLVLNARNPQVTQITTAEGWHDIDMSADFKFFIDTYSNATTPPITTLFETSGKSLKVLEDNQRLSQTLQTYQLKAPEWVDIPTTGSVNMHAYILKPSDFNPAKKYAVLVHIYGGPASQEVTNQYAGSERLWHQFLAEEHDIIVLGVDNRGTGGRGKSFISQTYKKLGQLEAEDYLNTAKWLNAQPWVNPDKLGIWGWSYGGFMTLNAMLTEGGGIYKAGIAVAPVADWKLYDTIYTERYMSTPQKNPDGYAWSPLKMAKNLLPHQKLMIVHGDADDNVHFQNTSMMINALQANMKQFDLMVYPNRNHGIYGGATRYHLYTMMTHYWLKNLAE